MRVTLQLSALALTLGPGLVATAAAAEGTEQTPPGQPVQPVQSQFVTPLQEQPPPMGPQPMGPQPMQQPPPDAMTQQQRHVISRRGLYTHLQGGVALPLSGPLSDAGAVGGWVNAAAGWEVPNGLSGFVELGLRYHSGDLPTAWGLLGTPGFSYLDVPLGIGARWTPLREFVIHPYFEGAVDIHVLVITRDSVRSTCDNALISYGLGLTAGLELDLTDTFSIELGARLDYIFSSDAWSRRAATAENSRDDLMLTPFLGGTYYY
jgi:hypothetical protein